MNAGHMTTFSAQVCRTARPDLDRNGGMSQPLCSMSMPGASLTVEFFECIEAEVSSTGPGARAGVLWKWLPG